ncbi:uncharacterized protein LOC125019686 isoform X3 [Mugil cephalus]|uniref:uncharacterized protein LOC125019686 isoform X3 n=1 Tax=Mugil cephalus TaxID=48193 RepID=UPI001FB69D5D|nr:uncharacterized protein LOC125019686 isoform X3 [Mugil cephalus]
MEINTLGKFDKTPFTLRKRRLSGPDRTTHGGHPDVFLSMMDDKDKDGKSLMCTATGFNTEDIVLNIKKNHCVLTKEDGVKTSGVRQHPDDTFWREEFGKCLKSDVSQYSCEVIHAESAFRLEKLWDPDLGAKGRIISSKFIDTNKPDVKMFAENSEVQTNIILTCLVSGFYPNNITLNMKRNGRILTREDGVKSSGVCSNRNDTFQRRDSVEIKKSDTSDFCCEVIHAASGSRVEKFWDHQLPAPPSGPGGLSSAVIDGGVGGVLFLVLVVVLLFLWNLGILGRPNRAANNPPGNYYQAPTIVVEDPPSVNGNATTNAEAQSLLDGNVPV